MLLPSFLYKYEAFTAQSLQNLKSQILYFGSPLLFNDPYDCALMPNIQIPKDEEVEEIRKIYLKRLDIPQEARQQFETYNLPELREMLLRVTKKMVEETVQSFLKNRGVACFSEKNDQLLMWSHYGGKYKGFCLEFSTTQNKSFKFKKVKYQSELPSIELAPLFLERKFDSVLELFCTKSEAWQYEREWRAIHNQVGTKYVYPSESLTGVFFGPDIDPQALEIVCLILAGQNKEVKLWSGTRSKTKFSVTFQQFTYTSYLDAKEKGLL